MEGGRPDRKGAWNDVKVLSCRQEFSDTLSWEPDATPNGWPSSSSQLSDVDFQVEVY